MGRGLRDDRGFTIVELLVGMTISLVIFGATLGAFSAFYQSAHNNDLRFDTTEIARNALDTQARQLRNLAKRLSAPVISGVPTAYDLIFQTSDPSRTWVRYCLDTTTAPATASRGRLWEAETSSGTPGTSGACPGSGWTSSSVVADYITNRINGVDRPLYTYTCADGTSACVAAGTYDKIVNIAAQSIVNVTPGLGARELTVSSGVYLRNQDQDPVASFAATATSTSRTVQLDGSASTDYQGRTLAFYWFKGTMPTSIACSKPPTSANVNGVFWGPGTFYIGSGITLTYTFPPADGAAGTAQNIDLVVCDVGDHNGTAVLAVPIPN